ncbi:MAG: alanyl-tRNA synthetase [Gammaproteobacteria bacterium]|nr:alanyl-tRNA synthetase [Gammaproteobacteria bacterium]MDH5778659.1 alanyl-tRNA synthetase [Gammaproteobacteria bacterium]
MLLQQSTDRVEAQKDVLIWLKRAGWLGFLFLLVKGMIWLTLPILLFTLGIGQ